MSDSVKIEALPAELIKLVWPNYTDKLITDEFQAAYKKAKKEERKYSSVASEKESPLDVLERSWLFKEASRVVEEYNDREARKAVFDLSMTR